jgi:hypothetical protein
MERIAGIGSRPAVGGSVVINVDVDPIQALFRGVKVVLLTAPRKPVTIGVIKYAINK